MDTGRSTGTTTAAMVTTAGTATDGEVVTATATTTAAMVITAGTATHGWRGGYGYGYPWWAFIPPPVFYPPYGYGWYGW